MIAILSPQRLTLDRPWMLMVLFLAVLPACVWAQIQLATIFGTITDTSGAAIPGAQVTILNQRTGLKRSTLTDLAGQYRIAGLPIGGYSVRVEKENFQTHFRQEIPLATASEVMMNVSLRVGERREQVAVGSDFPAIDATSSTVGAAIAERTLAGLPVNNRDLFTAVTWEPGVVPAPGSAPSLLSQGAAGRVSVNGMRPSWTNVLIDGMDANDPVFGYSPAGASGLFLGLNAFTEVRVLTQTLNAEYGGKGGGVIDAATKSGSNHIHGSMFESHRNAALDAKNYFDSPDTPIPAYTRNQFGGGVGGPLVHDRSFFFVDYEEFREVRASTAIATVPNALAHKGLLPSNSNPGHCSNVSPNGCVAVGVDPRVQPYLAIIPPSNGADHGDGTGDLITADKGDSNEHYGMLRIDHNFSNTHSLFGRYIIADSSSRVPSFGTPPGTYAPGFPVLHEARNQYFSVQDRKSLAQEWFSELRFGINRTTASSLSIVSHPDLSFSLLPNRPFGMLDVAGMSLVGNSPLLPLANFSTIYQIQEQLSRTVGRHTFKFGAEFRRIQSNGQMDFVAIGLYTFQNLSVFGFPVRSTNPALEFFLQALPLSYVGTVPSASDSHRGYRQSVVSGFAQDFFRLTGRLTLNAGVRYDFYSNPTEINRRLSVFRNPAVDSGPTIGKIFASTPVDLLSPQAGFAWNIFGDGKTVLRGGAGMFRDQLPVILYGVDRALPPFYGINSFLFPTFLNPQNAVLTQPINVISTTYHPKFPYALQYNLNVQREIGPRIILSAGYYGARGNHLTREAEQNPFQSAQGRRYNPNLPSPLLTVLTDAQSFYDSIQISVSKESAQSLSLRAFYALSHSIDDASGSLSADTVNDPPTSQDIFNRKGDRGRSGFDIRHNFIATVIYELPFGGNSALGGWEVGAIARFHSNVPFTPVLAFDNADLRSLLTSERPDLVGNPHVGVCPNGVKAGNPSCWFNPNAFAVPAAGQFGNAGRNILPGPAFGQFDLTLQKSFQLSESTKIALGVEAYNLFNHPNFAVPSNTQSSLSLGGNGDAVFQDAAGTFANNVGRIFTTVGTGRQIQLDARFTF